MLFNLEGTVKNKSLHFTPKDNTIFNLSKDMGRGKKISETTETKTGFQIPVFFFCSPFEDLWLQLGLITYHVIPWQESYTCDLSICSMIASNHSTIFETVVCLIAIDSVGSAGNGCGKICTPSHHFWTGPRETTAAICSNRCVVYETCSLTHHRLFISISDIETCQYVFAWCWI